jgi:hypothetical protein
MTFRCDTCAGDYEARSGNASARVYLTDAPCNHIEVRCTHCGAIEVIYLRPRRLEQLVREGDLPTVIHAEASEDLRRRAAYSWAEAEAAAGLGEHDRPATRDPDGGMQPSPPADLRTYQLTARHEVLLRSFGVTLANMPAELLWEELRSEHERRHPERWID